MRAWCAVVLLAGCALSHERDAGGALDGGRAMDAGGTWVSDAGREPPPGDASRVPDDVPNDVSNDVAIDAPAPVDELLRYAERRCAWMARCDAWVVETAWLRGEWSCVHAERRRAEELLSRGHVPPLRTWCDAPEVDADCDGVDDVTPCTPPPGGAPEGEPCVTDRECGLTSSAAPMVCGGCRCRAYRNEGEDCTAASPCGPDLVCGGSDGVCHRRPTLADGDACSVSDSLRVCREGSTCHRGTCVRSPRYGERCEVTGPRCLGTTRCVADAEGIARCTTSSPVVAAGERCEEGQRCAGGAPCPRERTCPTSCNSDPGVCAFSACDEAFDDCSLPPSRCPGL